MTYEYRFRSTGDNSDKYGVCEVCGKHCAEVFAQSEIRPFAFDFDGEHFEGKTYAGCRATVFGHEDCLHSVRRVVQDTP